MQNFILNYENFLQNLLILKKNKNEENLLKISNEISVLKNLLENFNPNFEKCFSLLFKHHSTMLCLRCDPLYKSYFKKNKKKKEILKLSEKMCEKLIINCYDFLSTMILFSEKAKKILIHIRKLLLFPKFNNEEIQNFKDYENKILFYKKCYLKNECRNICFLLLKSFGYNEKNSIPDFFIFNWIFDYFEIFDKRLNNFETELNLKNEDDNGRFLKAVDDIEVEFSTTYELDTFELATNIKNITFSFSNEEKFFYLILSVLFFF